MGKQGGNRDSYGLLLCVYCNSSFLLFYSLMVPLPIHMHA